MHRVPAYFLLIVALIITIFYGLYEGWYSAIIMWVLMLISPILYFKQKHTIESSPMVRLYFVVFSFYSIYMYFTNYIYVDNPSVDFFMMVDSMKFWDLSNHHYKDFNSLFRIYDELYFDTIRFRFFNLLSLMLGFFAQIFDENNILVQKYQSVFLSAITIPYIYLIFRKYFDQNKAFKYALLFGVFSYVTIYSIVFNRDPHIYFLYTIGFYLVSYSESKKHIWLKLILIVAILYGFRFENSLFFSLYVCVYFYLKSKKNKLLKLFIFGSLSIIIIFSAGFIIEKYQANSDAYQAQLDNVERKGHSFGANFAKLPPGVKQTLSAINGQLAPAVPFWRGWYLTNKTLKYDHPGYFTPWRFMESIAALCWLFVWGWIFSSIRRRKFKFLPLDLKLFLGIAIIFLLAASSSNNARRFYCVYPIIYVAGVFLYDKLSKKQKKASFRLTFLFIISLYFLFFAVKGGTI